MKWYKKQLDALKKSDPSVARVQVAPAKKSMSRPKGRSPKVFRDPMGQRNRNRSKTDAKPIFT